MLFFFRFSFFVVFVFALFGANVSVCLEKRVLVFIVLKSQIGRAHV